MWVIGIQSHWGLLEKSVEYPFELSSLRGEEQRDLFTNALLSLVENCILGQKKSLGRVPGADSRTPLVCTAMRTANGICQGNNSFCYTEHFNQRKAFS